VSQATLVRARSGDADAFAELTNPYRHQLLVHCYRLLGSLSDAEDMLQETLLAAWRGLSDLDGVAPLRAWLFRIATNRCLNALRDAGRRVRAEPVPPFQPPEPTRRTEVTWLEPYPDALLEPGPEARYEARETVELAFVAALQRMPPRQTAALVLRDVLGFSTSEVAGMLDTTETAVKGALQRARAAVPPEDPRPPPPESEEERELTRRFSEAFTADDIDGVVALLTDEAWLTMPPAPHEYQGPTAIGAFLRVNAAWRAGRRLRFVATRANTQPAFAAYLARPGGSPRGVGLFVVTYAGDRVAAITHFLDNGLLGRFGLPEILD
jgi:RNA polymerase sigma-70 factor (ECF subfamily)